MASLVAVTGLAITPAIAELSGFSPTTDPETGGFGGFPQWYQDSTGLRSDLCLAADKTATPPGFCLTAPPDLTKLPSVSKTDPTLSNFADEAFWWSASATTTTRTGGFKAILVLGTEAAFPNGDVIDGDQIAFNRTRIRVLGGLKNNVKYKITYPYGVKVVTATSKDIRKLPATINVTEDFGCGAAITACDFASLKAPSASNGRIKNPIGKPWLTWDASLPAAPVGYIADPGVDHKVTGSPFGTNFFKVEELAADGVTVVGQPVAFTNLFSVSGKISTLIILLNRAVDV